MTARVAQGRAPQPKLAVSQVGDVLEREADAVASRVVSRSVVPGRGPGTGVRAGVEAGADGGVGGPIHLATAVPARPVARQETPPAPAVEEPSGQPEVTGELESYITSVSGGDALPDSVRERIEPHLGADLTGVRVHATPAAAAAAAQLQARAFTYGRDIFLGQGESAADLELMAHEATHAVQQGAVDVYRFDLDIDIDIDLDIDVTGWIVDNLADAASVIPGYTMLTQVLGKDPITDEPVQVPPQDLLEQLLTYGPFGEAVAPLFEHFDVLGDVFSYVVDQLRANDLTFDRLKRDIAGAWDEFSVTEGISGNLEILEKYLDRLLADVRGFVDSIVDRVIEMVRAAVADVVQPLLETPQIAPIWSLATKVFHHDPLRGEDVEAPTVEILAEFLTLIGQGEAVAQMEERQTLQATADWLDLQWDTFTGILADLTQLFADAWDAITPANLPGLFDALPALVERGVALVGRILEFGATLAAEVLRLVKESLMDWLSEYASHTPGFPLLTVIIGSNPFTGEDVPRTPENLIRGFITLLPGGEETYDQLAESGVIGEAGARIESEMSRLGITWELVRDTFLGVWDLVTLENLLRPVETFQEIIALFGDPLARIFEFITVVMEVVVTLILAMMDFPSELLGNIIANAMQAIDTIMADPVQFLVNMLEAVKTGFLNFLDAIQTHLVQGLVDWLLGGLEELGIQLPTSFEPAAIFEFVLSVIGVTEETLWEKLGEQIGDDRVEMIRNAADQLSGAWEFVKDVQERGLVAVWDLVAGQLSSLWDVILEKAEEWITGTIIEQVTVRLISMLDPTGIMAVVNSFMVFFETVRSVVQYIREILEIIDRYVATLTAVAAGDIAPGAAMLELGLAAAIPVALGFLANILHLGNVPERIREIIESLREMIDEALTWLFEQAMRLGEAALGALGIGGGAAEEAEKAPAGTGAGAVDPADHVAYARHAASMLKEAPITNSLDPMEWARAFADAHEPQLSAALRGDVNLRYVFTGGENDAEDGRIGFEVVIAPNTTTFGDDLVVEPGDLRPLKAEAEAAYQLALAGFRELGNEKKTVAYGGGHEAVSGWGTDDFTDAGDFDALRYTIVSALVSEQHQRLGITQAVLSAFPEIIPTDEELDDAFAAMESGRPIPARESQDVPADVKPVMDAAWRSALAQARSEGRVETSRAGASDQGVLGRYGASHAERQVFAWTEARAIGVSRDVCGRCRREFEQEAKGSGLIVIRDPKGYMVFTSDGSSDYE